MEIAQSNQIFYCYKCNQVFNSPQGNQHQGNIKCNTCNGEFVEQLEMRETENENNSQNISINTNSNQHFNPNPTINFRNSPTSPFQPRSQNQGRENSVNNSIYNLNGRPINPNSVPYQAFRQYFGPRGNLNFYLNRNPNANQNPIPNQNINQNSNSNNIPRSNFNNPYANFNPSNNPNNPMNQNSSKLI